MPLYEHTFIARQDISPQQVEALTEEAKKIVEDKGGKTVKEEYWGLRSLQYRIKKNRKGHYQLLGLDAPAEAVHELERQLRIHDDVLRYMTIKVEEIDPETPSAILVKREDRKRRGDRGDRGDRGPRPERGDRDDRGPRPDRAERA